MTSVILLAMAGMAFIVEGLLELGALVWGAVELAAPVFEVAESIAPLLGPVAESEMAAFFPTMAIEPLPLVADAFVEPFIPFKPFVTAGVGSVAIGGSIALGTHHKPAQTQTDTYHPQTQKRRRLRAGAGGPQLRRRRK